MFNKKAKDYTQSSQRNGDCTQISDAEFFEDLQVLLNRESMLKADVANVLGLCLSQLEHILNIIRPQSSPLTIPNEARQRARDMRLRIENGET